MNRESWHWDKPTNLLEEGLGDEAQQGVLGRADGVVGELEPVVVVPVLPFLRKGHLGVSDQSVVGVKRRRDGDRDRVDRSHIALTTQSDIHTYTPGTAGWWPLPCGGSTTTRPSCLALRELAAAVPPRPPRPPRPPASNPNALAGLGIIGGQGQALTCIIILGLLARHFRSLTVVFCVACLLAWGCWGVRLLPCDRSPDRVRLRRFLCV